MRLGERIAVPVVAEAEHVSAAKKCVGSNCHGLCFGHRLKTDKKLQGKDSLRGVKMASKLWDYLGLIRPS